MTRAARSVHGVGQDAAAAARSTWPARNLLACTLDDLPGAREAVDIAGESPEGYPPLVEAIARHHGVGADRVATAVGCSGANFLALRRAARRRATRSSSRRPCYDPLPAAAAPARRAASAPSSGASRTATTSTRTPSPRR